jgi:hypothetical protein
MAFTCPILTIQRYGRACSQVDVPLTVIGAGGERSRAFHFDTGCDITMVSEDMAALVGLPAGGTPVHIRGSTASGAGRLVPVTFRFPPDAVSGSPGPDISPRWVVVAGRTNVALLNFHEVHEHYFLGTDDTDMYFTNC